MQPLDKTLRNKLERPILKARDVAAGQSMLLDCIVHFADLFRVEIRAYCAMTDHVYIHLRNREPNLGAYM